MSRVLEKQLNTCDTQTYLQTTVNVMFTKMQATKCFKTFGEPAVADMIK